jgi:hypothetical protein
MRKVLDGPPEPLNPPVDVDLTREALSTYFPVEKVSRIAGKIRGSNIEWTDTQRDIADPNDEAGEGVAGVADDYGVGNFYRMLANDQEHDADGNNLHKCGTHLLAAKLAHVADDHDSCHYHLGKAMDHFAAFHKAMKAATED